MPTYTPGAPARAKAPSVQLVARIRRMVAVAVIVAVLYTIFTAASKGACADGQTCVNLTLRPGVFVYVFLVAAVLFALMRVERRATDLPAALRILDRATIVIACVAVGAIVYAQVWFALIPLGDGTGPYFFPFPFGAVDLVTTPA